MMFWCTMLDSNQRHTVSLTVAHPAELITLVCSFCCTLKLGDWGDCRESNPFACMLNMLSPMELEL